MLSCNSDRTKREASKFLAGIAFHQVLGGLYGIFFQCSSMNSAGKKIILGADVQRSKKSCINASIQKHLSCFHEEKLRPLMVQKPEDSMPLCVGNEQVNGQ